MSVYATSRFWKEAADRAIRSFSQGALLAIGARISLPEAFAAIDMTTLLDCGLAAAISGMAMALLSLLTSIATAPIGPDKTSPSVLSDFEHQGLI